MTYRDRREAKAEKLTEWAEKRQAKAEAGWARGDEMASVIPFGQPILVGHYSEGRDRRYRARIASTFDKALEDQRKAEDMGSRAEGIRDQLASSIYSDDPDAIEALETRIAKLEAEREAIKAHNKEHRGSKKCTCPEDCNCRNPWQHQTCKCKNHPLPAYHLQNLSGNIKRNRDRLEVVRRQAARSERCEAAGGIAIEDHRSGYCSVTFSEKPDYDTRQALKDAGFRWSQGSWWGKRDQLPESVAS